MKSFMPMPQHILEWHCPKCGKEKITVENQPPWILSCHPFFLKKPKKPNCPKCKIPMVKVELFY